jgi:1,4-alpha-glucan branching enzyme
MSQRSQTIRLNAPTAKKVSLAGSFNDWRPAPMRPGKGGDWALVIQLAPGRHEFKFVVDGQWCCDVGPDGPSENAEGGVFNAFGTMNRVLKVPSEHETG